MCRMILLCWIVWLPLPLLPLLLPLLPLLLPPGLSSSMLYSPAQGLALVPVDHKHPVHVAVQQRVVAANCQEILKV